MGKSQEGEGKALEYTGVLGIAPLQGHGLSTLRVLLPFACACPAESVLTRLRPPLEEEPSCLGGCCDNKMVEQETGGPVRSSTGGPNSGNIAS